MTKTKSGYNVITDQEKNFMGENIKADDIDRTRNILALCEESSIAGIKTIVMLNDQGEKLDHTEKNLKDIKHEMKEADENLRKLEDCCHFGFFDWFTSCFAFWKVKDYDDIPIISKFKHYNDIDEPPPFRIDDPLAMNGIVMRTNAEENEEDEVEKNIIDVSSMLNNLKHMAVDIGAEIDHQNQQLDRIAEDANEDQERINEANIVATRLLSKD